MKQISKQNSKVQAYLLIVAMLLGFNHVQAEQMDLASEAPTQITYKINDGYGEYVGVGSTKIQASEIARESCVMQKVLAYESKTGMTPDVETAELFIDACINK